MCFLMGAAAGGMLPVAYALLAEIMPTRHRGWCLVLIGGVGAVGGYFVASGCSALLQPTFGWRVMWLLNFPTGLLLVLMSPWLPESARFLQQTGRAGEARAVLARFGVVTTPARGQAALAPVRDRGGHDWRRLAGISSALTLTALVWSLLNFGLLLWLPSALVAEGHSVAAASALIARSTLIAAPVVLLSTWLYGAWSTRGALMVMLGISICGLLGLQLRSYGSGVLAGTPLALTLLIIGSSGVIAILLPYTSENFPLRVRGRATGWVAGCSKLGGLLAQGLSVAGVTPVLSTTALSITLPGLAALALLARYGRETRLRDLRELEAEGAGVADSPRPERVAAATEPGQP
jgi:putative MFS transporter